MNFGIAGGALKSGRPFISEIMNCGENEVARGFTRLMEQE